MESPLADIWSIARQAGLNATALWGICPGGAESTWFLGQGRTAVSVFVPFGANGEQRLYECFAETHEPFVTNSRDEVVSWLRRRAEENR